MLRDHEDAAPTPPTAAAPAETAPVATPMPVVPSFDIVRISPEGDTVIAGRAAPGAQVTIHDGDTELGHAKADERGEWVFLPEKPLPPGTRSLSLSVTPPDGQGEPLRSEGDVVLVVPEPGTGGVVAVQVPKTPGGTSRVLQRPGDAASIAGLSIAAIDYDEKGRVGVSGSAEPDAKIVVYLDDVEAGRTTAAANTDWRVKATRSLTDGQHTVRADQIDAAGQVVRRAEVKFEINLSEANGAGDIVVVVQPGNSLWRIARRIYGEGMSYTQIFEANRSQIQDPNKIYPGQNFVAPKTRP
jgi:nucleoid-associated protein YgaU